MFSLATPSRSLSVAMAAWMDVSGTSSLSEADPELQDIISKEKNRQKTGLELIASEVCMMILY